jgi:glycosyltransferase involved in cell wall biosynthesis
VPVRIAIDASRTTIAARTGTENYALQLIRALLALGSSHEITLYFRDEPAPDLFAAYRNVNHKVIPFPRLWTHIRFAAELWKDRPDVTFVPAHALPLFFPGKAVATVHDLGYRFFPQAHPAFERRYLELTTRTSSWRASRILADSLATKRDLIAEYAVKEDKIAVVYPGVEGLRRADTADIAAVRAKYHLPERYFLFLGTLQPRKNITRLIEAFARYCTDSADNDISLVLAGKRGWLIEQPLQLALNALPAAQRERIILTGYVEDGEVVPLYSGALALVFPSLYEGFGFPVLEAMHCGTPVLCSNTSSLPELAGDAALLVDPLNIEAIANGMAQLATDSALRDALVQKGYQQVTKFTWNQAAGLTLQVLEGAIVPG